MRSSTYYVVIGVLFATLVTSCIAGFYDMNTKRANFYAAHHCVEIQDGYICKDGAVLK